jgi:hypothetical protein
MFREEVTSGICLLYDADGLVWEADCVELLKNLFQSHE